MYFDGSYLKIGSDTSIILMSPQGHKLRYAIHLHFDATNNVTEYEALVNGLRITTEVAVRLQVGRRPGHEGNGAMRPTDVRILW
jgi:ribonuclease HI